MADLELIWSQEESAEWKRLPMKIISVTSLTAGPQPCYLVNAKFVRQLRGDTRALHSQECNDRK